MRKWMAVLFMLNGFLGLGVLNLVSARDQALSVGEVAPDFSLPSTDGRQVALSQFRGKKKVVLYFYPRDNTPGCTAEAKNFNEDLSSYEKANAVVLGVSVDDAVSHKKFADKLNLKFPLLIDKGGKVASQYGSMGWIMAKRMTFVIGKDGKIEQAYPEVSIDSHSKQILNSLAH